MDPVPDQICREVTHVSPLFYVYKLLHEGGGAQFQISQFIRKKAPVSNDLGWVHLKKRKGHFQRKKRSICCFSFCIKKEIALRKSSSNLVKSHSNLKHTNNAIMSRTGRSRLTPFFLLLQHVFLMMSRHYPSAAVGWISCASLGILGAVDNGVDLFRG